MECSKDCIFVTYVEADHDVLKIWGQQNRTCASYIEEQLVHLGPKLDASPGPDPSALQKGTFCFVKCGDDYFRAKIISDVKGTSVPVLFIDYGNRDYVDASKVRVQDREVQNFLSAIIAQAEEFYLARVLAPSGGWTEETIDEIRRDLWQEEFEYRRVYERLIQINFRNEEYANLLVRRKLAREISVSDQKNYMLSFIHQYAKQKQSKAESHGSNAAEHSTGNYNYPPHQEQLFGQLGYQNQGKAQPRKVSHAQSDNIYNQLMQMNRSRQNGSNLSSRQTKEQNVNAAQNYVSYRGSNNKGGDNRQGAASVNSVFVSPAENQFKPKDLPPESAPVPNYGSQAMPGDPAIGPINNVFIEVLANQLKQHLLKDSPSETAPQSYVIQVLEVNTGHLVCISYIDDGPWSFSVQLLSGKNELNQLSGDLASVNLVPVKLPLILGQPCLAKSEEYGNLCRGVIVNISHGGVKVFYVDFGSTEDLPVTSIYELPPRFFKVKALSQKFALSGLKDIKPTEEIKKAFKEAVENELLFLYVTSLEGDNLPTCELYLHDQNIKRILNMKVRQIRQWLRTPLPNQGDAEKVVVTWIESPQKFFVQLKRNDADLTNLKLELAELGSKAPAFEPEALLPGTPCVCCYSSDEQWYRAVVTSKTSNDYVTVFYVDYGNMETVNVSRVKKIVNSNLIRQMNAQAIQCCLSGYENLPTNQETKDKLEDMILEKELLSKVVRVEGERVIVQLFDNDCDISLSLGHRNAILPQQIPPKGAVAAKEDSAAKGKGNSSFRRSERRGRVVEYKNSSLGNSSSDKSSSSAERSANWRSDRRKDSDGSRKEFKSWRANDHGDGKKSFPSKRSEGRGKGKASSVGMRFEKAANSIKLRGQKVPDPGPELKRPVDPEDVVPSGTKFKKKEVKLGSTQNVSVTYFLNPGEMYVHLISTNEKFRHLMDDIQMYYSTKLPMSSEAKEGDIVVCRFSEDGILYRAEVTKTNPTTVRYLDYGNEEVVVERDRLWPVDARFADMEIQALKCRIPGLKPVGGDRWPPTDAGLDKIFESEYYSCTVLDFEDGFYDVSLKSSRDGKDLREELIASGYAADADDDDDDGSRGEEEWDLTLLDGERINVCVSHVVDSSQLYVQINPRHVDAIEGNLKRRQESLKVMPRLSREAFCEGTLCLAEVGDLDTWRRARIIRTEGNEALIHLVDYGNKLSVTHDQVTTIPDGIRRYPPQALEASLRSEIPKDEVKGCIGHYVALCHGLDGKRLSLTLYDLNGEKLESQGDDGPDRVRPIGALPMLAKSAVIVPCVADSEIGFRRVGDNPRLEALESAMLDFYSRGGGDDFDGECVAAAKVSDRWLRAWIADISNGIAAIELVDHGNVAEVPAESLRKLDASFRKQHAFVGRLRADARNVVLGSECRVTLSRENGALCGRFDADAEDDDGDGDGDKDANVFISHASSPKEFWVHYEKSSAELDALQDEMQSACSRGAIKMRVSPGDVVGACYTDEVWYRAKVLAVDGDVLVVQFIDYGNSLEIDASKTEVIDLSADLIGVPVFATRCSLRGRWKESAAARFEEIITEHQEDPFVLVESGDSVDLLKFGRSVTEQLIEEGYHADAREDVRVTHVNSPDDFYVRRSGGENDSALEEIAAALKEAETFESAHGIQEHDLYCARCDREWRRAKVLARNGNDFQVIFVDYGNTCLASELKILPGRVQALPGLAANCCLAYGKTNDSWSEAACSKFAGYAGETLEMEVVARGARKAVVRLFAPSGRNVTEELEELCETDHREEVYVTHVNSPSDFFVANANDGDHRGSIEERLSRGEFPELRNKTKGTLCLAKFDRGWHRAEIRSVCDDSCDVYLVDRGHSLWTNELREMPGDVSGAAPAARNCQLDLSVANIPESVKEEFISLTQDRSAVFRMRVVRAGERDVVSLMLDGRKLEEVLMQSIGEMYVEGRDEYGQEEEEEKMPCALEGENGEQEEEDGEEEEYDEGNVEDDLRVVRNETDEEKRVKLTAADNTDGFKSDDEKGIQDGYAMSMVNVPDNELLDESLMSGDGAFRGDLFTGEEVAGMDGAGDRAAAAGGEDAPAGETNESASPNPRDG